MDILNQLIGFFTDYGYAAVFIVLLACGFGLPIPEDVTLVAGGIISGMGYTHVHTMVIVGLLGVLAGDGIMFLMGRIFGQKILKFRLIAALMTPERYEKVQEKFEKYGSGVLFFARFMPGLRSPIFLTAGMSGKVSTWKFLLMDGVAALVSVPAWVYIGYHGANNREWLLSTLKHGQNGIFIFLGIVVLAFVVYLYSQRKKKDGQK
jgi:membrane protein DedA with SNARE-associated domain